MNRPVTSVTINGPLVTLSPTGPAVYLTELTRGLLAARPELAVTFRHASARGAAANRESAALVDARVRPRTIPVPNRILRPLESRLRFPRESGLVGPFDVYHQVHLDDDPAVPDSKLVVTLHDTVALHWPQEEGPISRHAGKLLRRAAAVITVSEFSKGEICREFDVAVERVHVVYNGVDHARFGLAPEESLDARRFLDSLGLREHRFVLFAGGSTPRKNVGRIIDALSHLHESAANRDLRLVLAGPVAHAQQHLRARMPANLRPEHLIFTGFVPAQVMPHLYARAACLAYPSLQEGFGLPIVEALACGTPVVTSANGATAEVAGMYAELVDPFDSRAIADGVASVLRLGPAAHEARQARNAWAARFTWDGAARQVLGIYDSLAT